MGIECKLHKGVEVGYFPIVFTAASTESKIVPGPCLALV